MYDHDVSGSTDFPLNFPCHIKCFMQVLFELARFHAPSTIFMDELESIMGQRAGFGSAG